MEPPGFAIPNFPGYRIDDLGSIWSARIPKSGLIGNRWKKLKPSVDKQTGYPRVNLRRDGETFKKTVGVLVLETFVGSCPEGLECCHGDGIKTNNQLDNLRWDTAPNNQADRVKHGTSNRGSRQGGSVLTEEDVLDLVKTYRETPTATMDDIGILYGISKPTVSNILRGYNWSWLTGIKPGDFSCYGPNANRKRPPRGLRELT